MKSKIDEAVESFLECCDSENPEIPEEDTNLDYIEMNAFEDIAHYKDGSEKVLYHYCD